MTVCDWPLDYTVCGATEPDAVPAAIEQLTPAQRTAVEDMATEYLWRWSGRQFGLCPVTVRPCRQRTQGGLSTFNGGRPGRLLPSYGGAGSPFYPALVGGSWTNVSCGSCGTTCGCSDTPSIKLPGRIDSITEVVVDGAVLEPTAYRVDNGKYLVRIDGEQWPTCQDLSAPSEPGSSGAEGTWQVTYLAGRTVPAGGRAAAAQLAVEFAKALCRDKSCQLPQRVQTVTRQGVTVAVLDAFDDIDTGHTGIWMIDAWLSSVTKAPGRRGRVLSPDIPRGPRRTTWQGGLLP